MTSSPASARWAGRELFVYYRVPADRVAAVGEAVRSVQDALLQAAERWPRAVEPGPLRRRPGCDARGDVTLMEVYAVRWLPEESAPGGAFCNDPGGALDPWFDRFWAPLEARFKNAIDQAAGQPVARHLEWFEPVASIPL